MQQRESGTGQRHWSSIGEETFVGGMWLLYMLFRIGGRLPFRRRECQATRLSNVGQ